jgi:excisionase family DNA binding protein
MGQALQGGMQSGQEKQQTPSGGSPSGGTMPDVMTPAEAASFLKVTEEDILAAIKDGSLKAKKLGNAYRISKNSVDEFLKG